MPDTARLCGCIVCPRCGTHLLNSIRVSWGCVPGLTYQVGDRVRWLQDPAGRAVKAFELRNVAKLDLLLWNCGDPKYPDVDVFDEDVYTGNHQLVCGQCGLEIAGCVASVRDGIFQGALCLESAEVDRILGASRGCANIAVIGDAGRIIPREDWWDVSLVYNREDQGVAPK
jgi:hypothetical protein